MEHFALIRQVCWLALGHRWSVVSMLKVWYHRINLRSCFHDSLSRMKVTCRNAYGTNVRNAVGRQSPIEKPSLLRPVWMSSVETGRQQFFVGFNNSKRLSLSRAGKAGSVGWNSSQHDVPARMEKECDRSQK